MLPRNRAQVPCQQGHPQSAAHRRRVLKGALCLTLQARGRNIDIRMLMYQRAGDGAAEQLWGALGESGTEGGSINEVPRHLVHGRV